MWGKHITYCQFCIGSFDNDKFCRAPAVTRQKFKDQATRFFISILANLTFKYLRIGDRNEDLILLLMGFVTLDEKNISGLVRGTENVNIFQKDGLDPSPGFRAFLLQLFIRHRFLFSILYIYGIPKLNLC